MNLKKILDIDWLKTIKIKFHNSKKGRRLFIGIQLLIWQMIRVYVFLNDLNLVDDTIVRTIGHLH